MRGAGISAIELSVIIMRNQGQSTEDILDMAQTPEDRKVLQAAYRSLSNKLKNKIQLSVFRPKRKPDLE